MSWFKVDDGFYTHEKVLLIPRNVRALAIGTWTLCGTWSADKERDGFVPFHIIDEVAASPEGAEALVAVKLWRKTRQGYQFVNWAEWQPTREKNDERRQKDASRQAAYRERHKPRKDAGESEDVTPLRTQSPSLPSRPVPSRPDHDDEPSSRGTSRAFSTGEDDPVDNPLFAKIVSACETAGVSIHPLVVPDIIAFIDRRRGPSAKPIQAPERYYPGVVRDEWPIVSQFIFDEGLAS